MRESTQGGEQMSYTLDLRGYDLWEEIQTAKAALEKGYQPEKGPVQQFECAPR